ncbi:MAG TPA: glycine C-acetyltransferase [Galbitalea sp.]|jgi:glycine C-acetyltransferase
MRSTEFSTQLRATLDDIETAGLSKVERPLAGAQGVHVIAAGMPVLNFCANNYLGLANHPEVLAAARKGIDDWGFGTASVRFIAGTQQLHLDLEAEISAYLGTEATILFPSCFDANGAVFEVLLSADDAVISDELNHASIIDGIRLSRAARFRYRNRDLADLEQQLQDAAGHRRRLVVTDGVFSMDGYYAPLPEICALAEKYDALVMVDDSHAVGFVGDTGAGTPEKFGVRDRVDILTGTLGKALGGASGGYVSGPRDIVELLRQRGRPYLFSNAVAPSAVAGAMAALRIARTDSAGRARLWHNADRFRTAMTAAGFTLLPGEHAIVPVMFDDESTAVAVAAALFERGIYVTAFSYPVVPLGRARIRIQLSAAHSDDDIDKAVAAFSAASAEVRRP